MFTGLIETVGTVGNVSRRGTMIDITIEAPSILDDVRTGDSIAVSGVCLTVTRFDDRSFSVQAVAETLGKTTLAGIARGRRVNLERSLRLGDRLGGHIVQGHVDGTGKVVARGGTTENMVFTLAPDASLERYIAGKGSVTVDGVSLTVTRARPGEFGVSVIPHTLSATTLADLRPGDTVNIETDVLARYVEKLMNGGASTLTLDILKQSGF